MKHRIIVTAGNTWSPLDSVRVITNIFSGETGLGIAYQLAKKGFKVKLILGDIRTDLKKYRHKNISILRALTYKKFYHTVKTEVKKRKYSAIIHSAAVSDYQVSTPFLGKIKSSRQLNLSLNPTKKIVDRIKKWDKRIILIKFKLEANINKKELFKRALKSKKQSGADLVIANAMPFKKNHGFYVIKSKKHFKKISGKEKLAKFLAAIFSTELK
ncbi:MAG: hypothetical protein A2Y40_06065 [Candidatus Margulisbacteria bacterium GWF2_35_9]|nr:MAG: hypothetical protein A2Y40_06065 [Candidatus Margulisbacteria bacterium GWF2_35_9]